MSLLSSSRFSVPRLPALAAAAALMASQALGSAAAFAQSDPIADFYKGKNITMLVGFSTGNGADSYARLFARHLGRFIPGNPSVVVQNMPGSGSLVMANYLYSVAPKDGSVIGVFNRNVPMEPLMGNKNARFDARKFTWIGSANTEPSLCVAWGASPIKTWEDTKTREWVIAATGLNANSGLVPTLLNKVLGTKMKMIMGYPGASEMSLAMESGEVEGRCGWSRSSLMATKSQWVTEKKVNLLIQAGLQKNPALMDVPLAMDFVTSERDKSLLKLAVAWDEMAWPFMAPPDVPAARRDTLRRAFAAAIKDPQLVAEAEREKLDLTLVTGESIEQLLADIYATPEDIVAEMRAIITPPK